MLAEILLLAAFAASAFAQSPTPSAKLAGVKSFQVKGGIVRAAFCGEDTIVVTQGSEGTFRVITLADGKQEAFRSEGGERRRFEPTLIAPLGKQAVILDEARWQVHRFSLDGNSLAQASLPTAGDEAEGMQRPVGLATDGKAVFVLDYDGVLHSLNWKGEVLSPAESGMKADHLTQLRYDAGGKRFHVLQPLAGRIISFPTPSTEANGESDDAASVSVALEIPREVLGNLMPTDFALMGDGRMLITVGTRLYMKDESGFAPVGVSAGFKDGGVLRVEAEGNRVLLYNHSGEMIVGELK